MLRKVLTDSMWKDLEAIIREKGCYHSANNRNVMEAILWKLRTGSPWRNIPEQFCPWKRAYNRFNRWAQKGLWSDVHGNPFCFKITGGEVHDSQVAGDLMMSFIVSI